MENVSGKYFVVPENIKSGLEFLERRGLVEREFDKKTRSYKFTVKNKMSPGGIFMKHPEVFEGSLLD